MTFEEWVHHRFPAGVDGATYSLNIWQLKLCWEAAQEQLLKEMYPLRQTTKEQTNENR